jgi:glutamate dehydrogenase/leucine dehydrogenase
MSEGVITDNFLSNARAVVRRSAKRVGLNPQEIENLLTPVKRHEFSITVGDKRLKAYRVQHSNKRGPHKGGIRFHPDVTQGEVEALALLMSIKTAAVGIPLGGGKGGVAFEPKDHTPDELEHISREYVRQLHKHIGPHKDIPAPDVNTDGQVMDWMVDEYERLTGDVSRASFTGKPVTKGGSAGREAATGRGGLICLQEALKQLGHDKKRLTVAVQGFGNVGYWFARLAANSPELKIVAVSDSRATIVDTHGLDVDEVMQAKTRSGSVGAYTKSTVSRKDSDYILTMNVDVLVLAALDDAINEKNMERVQAHYLLELANGPISDKAYRHLASTGSVILPDVLANSGGVIVSYFEWLQNLRSERWSETRVNKELDLTMRKATREVVEYAQLEKVNFKDAAVEIAVRRIVE